MPLVLMFHVLRGQLSPKRAYGRQNKKKHEAPIVSNGAGLNLPTFDADYSPPVESASRSRRRVELRGTSYVDDVRVTVDRRRNLVQGLILAAEEKYSWDDRVSMVNTPWDSCSSFTCTYNDCKLIQAKSSKWVCPH